MDILRMQSFMSYSPRSIEQLMNDPLLQVWDILVDKLLSHPERREIARSLWGYRYWSLKNQNRSLDIVLLRNPGLFRDLGSAAADQLARMLGGAEGKSGLSYFFESVQYADRTRAIEPYTEWLLNGIKEYFRYNALMYRHLEEALPEIG